MKMKDVCGLDRTYRTMFLLCALLPLPTSADITCASCFAPIKTRGNEELEQIKPTAVVNRQFDSVTVGNAVKSGILGLDTPKLFPKAHVSRRERASPTEEKDGKVYSASSSEGIKVDRRVKRGLFPSERETSVNSAAAPRSEFRRTGGVDGTARGPRQNEPHLVTSTFALSGDSAHNQAMVLWSGHNSSVSGNFILFAKLCYQNYNYTMITIQFVIRRTTTQVSLFI